MPFKINNECTFDVHRPTLISELKAFSDRFFAALETSEGPNHAYLRACTFAEGSIITIAMKVSIQNSSERDVRPTEFLKNLASLDGAEKIPGYSSCAKYKKIVDGRNKLAHSSDWDICTEKDILKELLAYAKNKENQFNLDPAITKKMNVIRYHDLVTEENKGLILAIIGLYFRNLLVFLSTIDSTLTHGDNSIQWIAEKPHKKININ